MRKRVSTPCASRSGSVHSNASSVGVASLSWKRAGAAGGASSVRNASEYGPERVWIVAGVPDRTCGSA